MYPVAEKSESVARTLWCGCASTRFAKEAKYIRSQVVKSAFNQVIQISSKSYEWVEDVKAALAKSEESGSKVLLVTAEQTNGILGLVNCLTKEPGGQHLR